MNYKSQMKGWAVDRVIELARVTQQKITLDQVMAEADQLADYAYEPDSDFRDAIARISTILKSTPDALEKVNALQAELAVIEEDIHRQNAVQKAGNGNGKAERMQ